MGEIRFDVASGKARCDTCPACNYWNEETRATPTAIYALTIGAGYRQPSYLCPNCLNVLRLTLGVGNIQRTYDAATIATNEAQGFRVVADNAARNNEAMEVITLDI